MATDVIELLDEGIECPTGGRWHYQVSIEGDEWRRGDVYYVRDRHGVPRPIVFSHVLNGDIVCYSKQRFRLPDERLSVPAGYVNADRLGGPPRRAALTMSEDELEFQQIAADLLDEGEDDEAARLLDVYATTGDPSELEAAKQRALRIIDEHNETPS